VELRPYGETGPVLEIAQIVSDDGSFAWRGLRGGRYTIRAWSDGEHGDADVAVAPGGWVIVDVHIGDT